MKALVQRVTQAAVTVEGEQVGAIGKGILVLLGVEKGDSESECYKLAEKLINYRIFSDHDGRMNLSVKDVEGGVLVVSQFTLAADTRKGLRPSFTPAAPPEIAENLYQEFSRYCANHVSPVATGRFGADMQVSLCNNGPVTFLLEVAPTG